MADIRALGHIPRTHHENALYQRWRDAKRQNLLSESQLAELAELPASNWREVRTAGLMVTLMDEIRALGHIPRKTAGLGDENALACRLQYAKSKSLLSESQLAELAEIARSSDEPVRKRQRVLNDDV